MNRPQIDPFMIPQSYGEALNYYESIAEIINASEVYLEHIKNQFDNYDNKISEIDNNINSLETNIENLSKNRDLLKEKIEELENGQNITKGELSALNERVTAVEESLKLVESNIDKIQLRVSNLESRVDTQKVDIEGILERYKQLTSQVEDQKSQITELTSATNQNTEELETIGGIIAENTADIEMLKNKKAGGVLLSPDTYTSTASMGPIYAAIPDETGQIGSNKLLNGTGNVIWEYNDTGTSIDIVVTIKPSTPINNETTVTSGETIKSGTRFTVSASTPLKILDYLEKNYNRIDATRTTSGSASFPTRTIVAARGTECKVLSKTDLNIKASLRSALSVAVYTNPSKLNDNNSCTAWFDTDPTDESIFKEEEQYIYGFTFSFSIPMTPQALTEEQYLKMYSELPIIENDESNYDAITKEHNDNPVAD